MVDDDSLQMREDVAESMKQEPRRLSEQMRALSFWPTKHEKAGNASLEVDIQ